MDLKKFVNKVLESLEPFVENGDFIHFKVHICDPGEVFPKEGHFIAPIVSDAMSSHVSYPVISFSVPMKNSPFINGDDS